jgi:hypothetical protein
MLYGAQESWWSRCKFSPIYLGGEQIFKFLGIYRTFGLISLQCSDINGGFFVVYLQLLDCS